MKADHSQVSLQRQSLPRRQVEEMFTIFRTKCKPSRLFGAPTDYHQTLTSQVDITCIQSINTFKVLHIERYQGNFQLLALRITLKVEY